MVHFKWAPITLALYCEIAEWSALYYNACDSGFAYGHLFPGLLEAHYLRC